MELSRWWKYVGLAGKVVGLAGKVVGFDRFGTSAPWRCRHEGTRYHHRQPRGRRQSVSIAVVEAAPPPLLLQTILPPAVQTWEAFCVSGKGFAPSSAAKSLIEVLPWSYCVIPFCLHN